MNSLTSKRNFILVFPWFLGSITVTTCPNRKCSKLPYLKFFHPQQCTSTKLSVQIPSHEASLTAFVLEYGAHIPSYPILPLNKILGCCCLVFPTLWDAASLDLAFSVPLPTAMRQINFIICMTQITVCERSKGTYCNKWWHLKPCPYMTSM